LEVEHKDAETKAVEARQALSLLGRERSKDVLEARRKGIAKRGGRLQGAVWRDRGNGMTSGQSEAGKSENVIASSGS